MTAEERVYALHARMDALREKQERRKTAALGAGCGLLGACLILLIGSSGTARGGTAGPYSGANGWTRISRSDGFGTVIPPC